MRETQAYACDYCGKLYRQKHHCLWHERVCCKNPQNQTKCFDCKYLDRLTIDVKNENEYYTIDKYGTTAKTIKVTKYHCNKLDRDLYPVIVLRKKLHLRHSEHFSKQEQMPSECEYFALIS